MPFTVAMQTSFNAGEWSEELRGRPDMQQYGSACLRMENFYPLLQGPARRRPGSRYIINSRNNEAGWLMPFVFSQNDALVLHFTNLKLRFYSQRGAVLEASKAITGATAANPVVVTSVGHGYSDNDIVYITGVAGMTQLNGSYYRVDTLTADTFALYQLDYATGIDGSAFTAYTSGGTVARVYEVTTPYTTAMLTTDDNTFGLRFTQRGDVIYLMTQHYPPQKLTRLANNNWSIATFTPEGGPIEDMDPDNTVTAYGSARTGSVTVITSSNTFASSDVGRLFYLEQKSIDDIAMWEPGKSFAANAIYRSDGKNYESQNAATSGTVKPVHSEGTKYDGVSGVQWEYRDPGYGTGVISGYTSATQVTVTVANRFAFPDGATLVANASTRWAKGEWAYGATSAADNFPTHCTFFRERLVAFRSRDQKGWFSVAADYENFKDRDDGGLVVDDAAISLALSGDLVNPISWISAGSSKLLIGTNSGVHIVGPMTNNQVFGPLNVRADPDIDVGSANVDAVKVAGEIFYVQAAGRALYSAAYDINSDKFRSYNRSAFNQTMVPLAKTITQLSYQQQPHSCIWAVRSDGLLMGYSYSAEFQVQGWHRHPIGNSACSVESIAVIPSYEGGRDELWAVVAVTVNAATQRHVVVIEKEWDSSIDQDQAFYLDDALTYSGTATTTVRGLQHLRGKTIQVLVDGSTHPDVVVSAQGAITLQRSGSVVHAGFQSDAKLATMPINAGTAAGTPQMRIKRLTNVGFRFFETWAGKVGSKEDKTDTLSFRSAGDAMDAPPPVFTGDKLMTWNGDYERDGVIWYIQDKPLPATILAIVAEVVASG